MVVKQASKVTNALKVGIMFLFLSYLNHSGDLLQFVRRRSLTI